MFRFLLLSHCVLLLPSSCCLHKAPRAASEAEEKKKTPACAAKIPMVTEAEGAARDSFTHSKFDRFLASLDSRS